MPAVRSKRNRAQNRSNAEDKDAARPHHMQDDPTWTQGDFVLTTSDHVQFRVPSFHLLSARWGTSFQQNSPHSLAFSNAAKIQRSGTSQYLLHLTDATCETADVLRSFLELVCNCTLSLTFQSKRGASHYAALSKFIDKWECAGARAGLTFNAREQVHRDVAAAVAIFVGAAVCDDTELCGFILQAHPRAKWAPQTGEPLPLIEIEGKCIWDPTGWPAWFAVLCPPAYLWALARSYRGHQHDFSSRFEKLLQAAKK